MEDGPMALTNWLRPRSKNPAPKPTRRPGLGIQQLEDRTVPTVGLASAFGTTSDIAASQARDVAVDAAGNSYLTGWFTNTLDFDPANDRLGGADVLTSRGGQDIFVAKYAADDSLVWVRQMGGPTDTGTKVTDVGEAIDVDAAGNVYVAGRFKDTADFGPVSLTSAGSWDGFAAKLTPAGAVSWAKRWGTTADEVGLGVEVDAAGNVAVVGGRTYVTPSGSLYSVDNNHGLDILKYTPTGGSVWTPKFVNTRAIPTLADLTVDAGGSLFVAGSFAGTVDFNPGTKSNQYFPATSGPGGGGFVLKLTAAGAFAWVSPFQGQRVDANTYGYSSASSIALDGGGNVFVAGYYGSVVDFDKGTGTTTLPAVGGGYIAKLTPTGGLAWARALEKDPAVLNSMVHVYGLATDAAGNVYATGNLYGGADFDPGAGSASHRSAWNATDNANSSDVFVMKLTASGEFAWAETFGGPGSDAGWGIAVDSSGMVYLSGSYMGSVDFDPDPLGTHVLNSPGSNLFLVKLRQN
jgi:hypothetical protein